MLLYPPCEKTLPDSLGDVLLGVVMELSIAGVEVVEYSNLRELAELTVSQLREGRIALSGGSTYGQLFPIWAELNPDCRDASFFPVDERIVPIDDPQSNWGVAVNKFLNPVGKSEDAANFAASPQQYGELLEQRFGNSPIVFDRIFLGVGGDGHVASLFPGGEYWEGDNPPVIGTTSPIAPFPRISLSPQVLETATKLVVILHGESKRWAMEQLNLGNESLPITKILNRRDSSTLYIESALLQEPDERRQV